MKLTIVIPTYNESGNISILIPQLFSLPLENLNVLIVDDNSPDGTADVAEKLGHEYDGRVDVLRRPGKLGMGTAYIEGFQYLLKGDSDAIGQMDADFSHPPEKIIEILEALKNNDIAIGSRYVPGGSLDERWPLWRKGLSSFGNFYARTILNLPLRDVTAGYRMFNRHVLQNMPLHRVRSNGYIFQVEMSYVAHKLGFTFKEIPIYFADRRWGKSKMSFRIQVEAAIRVWKLLTMYRDLKKLN